MNGQSTCITHAFRDFLANAATVLLLLQEQLGRVGVLHHFWYSRMAVAIDVPCCPTIVSSTPLAWECEVPREILKSL